MISHDGMGCVAALDVDTGTLTLVHSGALARMNNKPETPRVIPLGAIESVEPQNPRR
ncbi:hypothetical protein [Antrihabitans spumae]|uniref:Uncharacterized protein n=1 Tax=Antrihabitans spumae TaxID=3373370 RepID=A0ABW7K5T8_9NOCA